MVEGWHTALSTARAASYPRQQRPTYRRLRPLPPGAGYARARLRRCIPSYPRSRSSSWTWLDLGEASWGRNEVLNPSPEMG